MVYLPPAHPCEATSRFLMTQKLFLDWRLLLGSHNHFLGIAQAGLSTPSPDAKSRASQASRRPVARSAASPSPPNGDGPCRSRGANDKACSLCHAACNLETSGDQMRTRGCCQVFVVLYLVTSCPHLVLLEDLCATLRYPKLN